jgi:tetratricopeptide (TPR) repeat protein
LDHHDQAMADANRAVKLDKSNRWSWQRLAQAHETQQEWASAAKAYEKFFNLQPDDSSCWLSYANALIAAGQLDEYRIYCVKLVERNTETEDPQKALRIISCLNKAPNAVEDWITPIRLAELVLASEKPDKIKPACLFCRAGQYQRSIELREESINEAQQINGWDFIWLGLAYHGLNELEEAQSYLAKAEQYAVEKPGLANDPNYPRLYRELSELLVSKTASTQPEKSPVIQKVTSEDGPDR